MSQNFEQEQDFTKIPYDLDDIVRPGRYNKGGDSYQQSPKKFKVLSVVIGLVLILNIALTVVVASLWSRLGGGYSYNPSYVSDPAKSTSINDKITEGAVSLAMRSAVLVEAFTAAPGSASKSNAGAGVILSAPGNLDGYVTIVTNYHVVYLSGTGLRKVSDYIYIFLSDYFNYEGDSGIASERMIKCEFIGGTYSNDLAVIRFPIGDSGEALANKKLYVNSKASPAIISNSESLSFGDTVFAVGNPAALGTSLTMGVVSKPYSTIRVDVLSSNNGAPQEMDCIQIDTAINSGNSGGGLFNVSGHLVGLVNAKYDNREAMAYAIPSSILAPIAYNIISNFSASGNAELKVPNLGIVTVGSSRAELVEIDDILQYIVEFDVKVTSASVGSLGYISGIRQNDIIKSVTYADPLKNFEQTTVNVTKPYTLSQTLNWISPVASAEQRVIIIEVLRGSTTHWITINLSTSNFVIIP